MRTGPAAPGRTGSTLRLPSRWRRCGRPGEPSSAAPASPGTAWASPACAAGSARVGPKKFQKVILTVSPRGLSLQDAETKETIGNVSIYRISYCTTDKLQNKVFAYVAQNSQSGALECHAFLSPKKKIAQAVTLTVAQAFQVALDLWEAAQAGGRRGGGGRGRGRRSWHSLLHWMRGAFLAAAPRSPSSSQRPPGAAVTPVAVAAVAAAACLRGCSSKSRAGPPSLQPPAPLRLPSTSATHKGPPARPPALLCSPAGPGDRGIASLGLPPLHSPGFGASF
ncbi:numb-like protein isoform X3 [Hemicordylus capensis]|uniref:numb-like protein isoform X3 n=1 Tax=Hemicordylus capensis TaxID=884348 RepID=UPI002304B629|nr:numb-like protein isoform X3 [Hemicordylus capensis]